MKPVAEALQSIFIKVTGEPVQKRELPPAFEAGGCQCFRQTSEVVINNSSDVEYRSHFKGTSELHKRKGLFGKRLAAVAIQIKNDKLCPMGFLWLA